MTDKDFTLMLKDMLEQNLETHVDEIKRPEGSGLVVRLKKHGDFLILASKIKIKICEDTSTSN